MSPEVQMVPQNGREGPGPSSLDRIPMGGGGGQGLWQGFKMSQTSSPRLRRCRWSKAPTQPAGCWGGPRFPVQTARRAWPEDVAAGHGSQTWATGQVAAVPSKEEGAAGNHRPPRSMSPPQAHWP